MLFRRGGERRERGEAGRGGGEAGQGRGRGGAGRERQGAGQGEAGAGRERRGGAEEAGGGAGGNRLGSHPRPGEKWRARPRGTPPGSVPALALGGRGGRSRAAAEKCGDRVGLPKGHEVTPIHASAIR